jgi:hypothetical protein
MAKFARESGRIRAQEKSFQVPLGGAAQADCPHAWYREAKYGATVHELCVLCGKPKADCERELDRRRWQASTMRERREGGT